MKKLKVVQIVRAPQGGIRKHVLEIIDNIDNTKFESVLITNTNESDSVFNKWKNQNIQIIEYPIVDSPGFNDIRALIYLYKIIRTLNVDIIHGHGAKGGLYARIIGRLLRKKVIYTAHGGSLHKMHGVMKNIIYKIVEKALYYLTDVLVFESKYSMNTYIKNIHVKTGKFVLNYNAIRIKLPETLKEISLDQIRIGAFGLLRKIKGHDILIEAVINLLNKGYNIELTIFGNGEEQRALESLITKSGKNENIKIRNYCENVEEEIKKCDIVAHPSLFESFGYVPLEAMNEGVTVVSSLEGGLKEVMNNGELGYCIKHLSVENLESTLEEAISDKDGRLQKYEYAKKYIRQNFDFEKFIHNIEEIYTKYQITE